MQQLMPRFFDNSVEDMGNDRAPADPRLFYIPKSRNASRLDKPAGETRCWSITRCTQSPLLRERGS